MSSAGFRCCVIGWWPGDASWSACCERSVVGTGTTRKVSGSLSGSVSPPTYHAPQVFYGSHDHSIPIAIPIAILRRIIPLLKCSCTIRVIPHTGRDERPLVPRQADACPSRGKFMCGRMNNRSVFYANRCCWRGRPRSRLACFPFHPKRRIFAPPRPPTDYPCCRPLGSVSGFPNSLIRSPRLVPSLKPRHPSPSTISFFSSTQC